MSDNHPYKLQIDGLNADQALMFFALFGGMHRGVESLRYQTPPYTLRERCPWFWMPGHWEHMQESVVSIRPISFADNPDTYVLHLEQITREQAKTLYAFLIGLKEGAYGLSEDPCFESTLKAFINDDEAPRVYIGPMPRGS